MSGFKNGDAVHHKTDLRTVWIIDKLKDDTAICSTSKNGVTTIEEMALVSLIGVIKKKSSDASDWVGAFL